MGVGQQIEDRLCVDVVTSLFSEVVEVVECSVQSEAQVPCMKPTHQSAPEYVEAGQYRSAHRTPRTENQFYVVPREGCVSALRSPIPISESRVEAKQIQSRNVSHRDANCELKRQTPTVMTTPTRTVRLDGAASARGAPRGSCGVRLGRWDSKEQAAQGCILFVARITANPTRWTLGTCCGRDFGNQKCKSRTPRAELHHTG